MKNILAFLITCFILSACTVAEPQPVSFISGGNDYALVTLHLQRGGDASLDVYFMPPLEEADEVMTDSMILADDAVLQDTDETEALFTDTILLSGKWDMKDNNYVIVFDERSPDEKPGLEEIVFDPSGNVKSNVMLLNDNSISFSASDTVLWIMGVRCEKVKPTAPSL